MEKLILSFFALSLSLNDIEGMRFKQAPIPRPKMRWELPRIIKVDPIEKLGEAISE